MPLPFNPAMPNPHDPASNGTWGDAVFNALALLNQDQFKQRTTDSASTSVTTLADDTVLQGITLGVGTWEIELEAFATGAAGGDIKFDWVFSGTTTLVARGGRGPAPSNTDALGATAQGIRSAGAGGTTNNSLASAPGYGTDGTNISLITEKIVLVVSVAGDLKLRFACVAAVASTVLKAGSWVKAHRVA